MPAIPGCATQGDTLDELMETSRGDPKGCLSVDLQDIEMATTDRYWSLPFEARKRKANAYCWKRGDGCSSESTEVTMSMRKQVRWPVFPFRCMAEGAEVGATAHHESCRDRRRRSVAARVGAFSNFGVAPGCERPFAQSHRL